MAEETGGIARVTFRVRAETLGFGESVYLTREDDSGARVSFVFVDIVCIAILLELHGGYFVLCILVFN
jgi:hypothetical protein